LKYLRSATFGSKDIVIRKSEFVAKTQFLYKKKEKAVKGRTGRPKRRGRIGKTGI